MKPFSQACENNKAPILQVLEHVFVDRMHILEIGSGTGQHAAYFAPRLPHLVWQTSDQPDYHSGIKQWLADSAVNNLKPPLAFTIGQDEWPQLAPAVDGVFTANTAHIMQPQEAAEMMALVAEQLPDGGVFCQYGPFKFDGEFTSDSNRQFHRNLLAQGCGGIRDVTELKGWAANGRLSLIQCYDLPANNHMLLWRKPG